MHGVESKWFARSVDRHTDMATYLVPSMCLDLARYSTLWELGAKRCAAFQCCIMDMFAVAWPLWSPANSATQNCCTNVLVDFLMVVCIIPKPVSDVLLCSSLKVLRYFFLFLELRLLEVGSSVPFCVALQQVPARMSYRAVQWNVFGGSSTCMYHDEVDAVSFLLLLHCSLFWSFNQSSRVGIDCEWPEVVWYG